MRVNVRNLAAGCPKCGAEDFEAVPKKDAAFVSHAELRCIACGAVATYIELITQIARKAVALSAATRAEIQQKRRK